MVRPKLHFCFMLTFILEIISAMCKYKRFINEVKLGALFQKTIFPQCSTFSDKSRIIKHPWELEIESYYILYGKNDYTALESRIWVSRHGRDASGVGIRPGRGHGLVRDFSKLKQPRSRVHSHALVLMRWWIVTCKAQLNFNEKYSYVNVSLMSLKEFHSCKTGKILFSVTNQSAFFFFFLTDAKNIL